jgi:GDPmannose 4,6-dehydratase
MTTTSSDEASSQRRALICGVGGQDGSYLARFLIGKGYEVFGSSRDATSLNRQGLSSLGIADRVRLVSMTTNDFRSVLQTITRVVPDEIYNLAGQTSVGLSFEQPVEAIESIAIGVLNLLEAIRYTGRPIRLYNAGSSECFGDTEGRPATEATPFRPRSPYAVAKACAHNLVANYRDAYRMSACTGMLFNHESPLRPERFVTQKVVRAACRIANGSGETLQLGNLDIHRDWGWAPEYVEVMWLMLQQEQLQDYVIATGRTVSLEYFVARVFEHFGLEWRRHVRLDSTLLRPSDIRHGSADPSLASRLLGWQAKLQVDDVIEAMGKAAELDLRAVKPMAYSPSGAKH